MIKGYDREMKKRENKKNYDENSGPLVTLVIDCQMATNCNADCLCQNHNQASIMEFLYRLQTPTF